MMKASASQGLKILLGAGILVIALSFYLFLPREIDKSSKIPALPESFSGAPVPTDLTAVMESAHAKAPARENVHALDLFISGRVRDRITLEPVNTFDFELQVRNEEGRWITALHRTVRDEEGAFFFPVEREGRAKLFIRSPCHGERKVEPLVLPARDLTIDLDPGLQVTGTVVDETTGEPVAGAMVVPFTAPGDDALTWFSMGQHGRGPHAFTGSDGRFTLGGLVEDAGRGKHKLAAAHPEYAEGITKVDLEGDEPVILRLARGYCIYGWGYDDRGKPLPGLLIRMSGEAVPVNRPALTRANGRYRTAPARPGKVYLTATQAPEGAGIFSRFTDETRIVEIKDRDVQVNFGLFPDQVTWQGTLFDVEGEPLCGARIVLSPADANVRAARRFHLQRTVVSDPLGRFEFRKLGMGSYKVDLFPPGASHIAWDDVAFKRPGVVERDIRIEGAVIHGRVVDSMSGRPHLGKEGAVHVYSAKRGFKGYYAGIDEEGEFRLAGLVPGSYNLTATVRGLPAARLNDVEVGLGEVIRNLEVRVPSGGELHLVLEGFFEEPYRECSLRLEHESGRTLSFPERSLSRSGSLEEKHVLMAGMWKAHLKFGDWAFLERDFEIRCGLSTLQVIGPGEVSFYRGPVSLMGSVVFADGSPAPRVMLRFEALKAYAPAGKLPSMECKAGEDGCFVLPGFVPGLWEVRAYSSASSAVRLPDLDVSTEASYTITHLFVVPGGTVRGRLNESGTGQSLEKKGVRWWASVHDAATGQAVSECEGGPMSSCFELSGIPAGDYRLLVSAEGFADYSSQRFILPAGQVLDLGGVQLDECGAVELEVMDHAGAPVSSVRVLLHGEELPSYNRTVPPQGRYRIDQVPLGPSVLTVEAEGYKSRNLIINLAPGKAGEFKLVLE